MSKRSLVDRLDDWEAISEGDACLSFVVRAEAVQRKWPGGLAGYLRDYRADHDDGVATNCAYGLDIEHQLVDLGDKGLEMDRDFIFLDPRDRAADLDGAPFPMPVGWLGGLWRGGDVRVYLKQ